jgi:hypothetical protein
MARLKYAYSAIIRGILVQRVLYFVIEQKELMHTSLIYPDFYIVKIEAVTSFHSKSVCNHPDISTHALAVFIGLRTRQ